METIVGYGTLLQFIRYISGSDYFKEQLQQSTKSRVITRHLFVMFGSARLHCNIQGIVYIDDIIMMIILQIIIPQIIIYYKYTTSYHLAGSIRFLINFFLTPQVGTYDKGNNQSLTRRRYLGRFDPMFIVKELSCYSKLLKLKKLKLQRDFERANDEAFRNENKTALFNKNTF